MTRIVNEAMLKDIDFLVEMRMEVLREVFSIPSEQDMSELEERNRLYYTHAIPTGDHIACLAFEDGVLAGCGGICFYQEMPSPDNPSGLCGYLMNVYTRPSFRKTGVGEYVVNWLIDKAKERGATKISLETTPTARHLYEKIGFVPMLNDMQLTANEKE